MHSGAVALIMFGGKSLDSVSKAVAMVCISLIDIISIAMFVRAIMSWFVDGSNKIYNFLFSMTEPIIIPIRKLLSKTSLGTGLPIDLSFLLTVVLLEIIRTVLEIYF